MTIDADHDLFSIGQLAAHLQQSVRAIERAAEQEGIGPSLKLNGVPYFDAAQVERLTALLRRDQGE